MSNPGYTFVGWNTAPDGSGTEYQAGGTMSLPEIRHFTPNGHLDTYTVSYSYDGGLTTLNSANFVVGTAALTLPTSTLAGSTFNGWFSAVTGGTLIGLGGTSIPTDLNHSIVRAMDINRNRRLDF